MITMTVAVLIKTKIVTTQVDKIVLTTMSIAVSLYQQYCEYWFKVLKVIFWEYLE